MTGSSSSYLVDRCSRVFISFELKSVWVWHMVGSVMTSLMWVVLRDELV